VFFLFVWNVESVCDFTSSLWVLIPDVPLYAFEHVFFATHLGTDLVAYE